MRVEEIIRDYIAENLNFLSSDLTLIQKEFYLNAPIGSKGFIDILAKDSFNNYVVIEIKRSEQAARQTLNELLKYQGLLKQIFKVPESEIKLMIVSTSWNELIVPFSEIYKSVYIVGYEIKLDNENLPISKIKVEPVNYEELERKLSPVHSIDLFFIKEKRDCFTKTISERLKSLKIEDFVIVKLNSNGKDQNIMYPYANYLAFQRQSLEKYSNILDDLQGEIEDIEFDSKDHKLHYIDELLLIQLETHKENDGFELGSPEKFMSILSNGNWEIENVEKFGVFQHDPRFNDELIINEIKGYSGENEVKYFDFADSDNLKKLLKIKSNIKKSISWNKKLCKHIDNTFSYLGSLNKKYHIIIEIYYPRSIFDSIWRYHCTNDSDYMPFYNIFVSFKETNELLNFRGETAWNGKLVNTEKVIKKLTHEDPFITFMQSVIGSYDKKLLELMNIQFVNKIVTFEEGKVLTVKNISFKKDSIITDENEYFGYESFFSKNESLMASLNQLYSEFTFS